MKNLRRLALFVVSMAAMTSFSDGLHVDAQPGEKSTASNHADIIVRDVNGTGFTDLRMLYRSWGCIERTPKLDLKTLHNAKHACLTIGGRLPKLSEADSLASHISANYLLDKKDPNTSVLKSRVMNVDKHFWTETLQLNDYVYKRALATLSGLESSTNMTKAKVIWELTSEDDSEYRPYLCVFDQQ